MKAQYKATAKTHTTVTAAAAAKTSGQKRRRVETTETSHLKKKPIGSMQRQNKAVIGCCSIPEVGPMVRFSLLNAVNGRRTTSDEFSFPSTSTAKLSTLLIRSSAKCVSAYSMSPASPRPDCCPTPAPLFVHHVSAGDSTVLYCPFK